MIVDAEVDANIFKEAGAELFTDGRRGILIDGWEIESRKGSILSSLSCLELEQKLETSHLPEMVFGDSLLFLQHKNSGIKIHFNAFDALIGWKQLALPPVKVPAAEIWKSNSRGFQQVVVDYDYTFTTPYCGSETINFNLDKNGHEDALQESCSLFWEDIEEQMHVTDLASKETILFFDEVILYEDELADNGVSLLTVKVRVMPSCWFLLLQFWLRVDGVLMRLRETRMHCTFGNNGIPIIVRECCWREASFQYLSSKGYSCNSCEYCDPSKISERLPVVMHKRQKLQMNKNLPRAT